jgi:hypothetical protein
MLSIFQFVRQISSLGELFQNLSGDPGERDGDQFLFSEASEDGVQYGLGRGPRITMPRFKMPSNVSSGVKYKGLSPTVREKDGDIMGWLLSLMNYMPPSLNHHELLSYIWWVCITKYSWNMDLYKKLQEL